MRVLRVAFFLFLTILLSSVSLFAQQQKTSETIQLDIESHSGWYSPGARIRAQGPG